MAKFLTVTQICVVWVTYFFFFSSFGYSQDREVVDSTIVKVVNPERQLKLWYGSDDFPISDFVVLPKFTILYNQETGKIRLLNNTDKLVSDEYNLREINKIMLINGTNRIGKKIKYPLGPINAWFTIQDDSTVLGGTVTLKKSKSGSGYVKISIRNSRLKVDAIPYIINLNEKLSFLPKNTSYITSLYQIDNNQLFVTPYDFLREQSDKGSANFNGKIYIKNQSGTFKDIYSIENTNDKLLNPIQITITDSVIVLYDAVNDITTIYDRGMNFISSFNLNKIAALHERPRRFFGKSFFWDASSNERLCCMVILVPV